MKYNLTEQIELAGGVVLKAVVGGHLNHKPFLTLEHSGVDVTQNGWGNVNTPAGFNEERAIITEAKRRKLKFRKVSVLARNLRGKLDLHHRPYTGSRWVFVECLELSAPRLNKYTNTPHKTIQEIWDWCKERVALGEHPNHVWHDVVQGYNMGYGSVNSDTIKRLIGADGFTARDEIGQPLAGYSDAQYHRLRA